MSSRLLRINILYITIRKYTLSIFFWHLLRSSSPSKVILKPYLCFLICLIIIFAPHLACLIIPNFLLEHFFALVAFAHLPGAVGAGLGLLEPLRALLLAHDTDSFNRWEAGRTLARHALLDMIRTGAAPVPHRCRTGAAAVPQRIRTGTCKQPGRRQKVGYFFCSRKIR